MNEMTVDIFRDAVNLAIRENREFTLVASGSDVNGLVLRVFPKFKPGDFTSSDNTDERNCEPDGTY